MTELAELPVIKYPLADAAIQKLADEYMPLVIRDQDDKEGYAVVREARLNIVKRRTSIEKKRKELKADALEYGRKVDGEAKRLTALLEPIETHLQDEEDRYNAEKERIKRQAEEARREKLQARMDALREVLVYSMTPETVEEFSDAEFEHLLEGHRKNFEAQKAREAAEAEARRVEAEKLAAERAALEESRRLESERLAEESAKLERERDAIRREQSALERERERIESEGIERQRQKELEEAKKEAAERAKREAEDDQRRKEEEAKQRAAYEEAERKRLEALRPDSEKLAGVADAVHAIVVPEVSRDEDAMETRQLIVLELTKCEKQIRWIAEELIKKG